MKAGIHPEYVETKVSCSCGNTFETRSTVDELHVELCNECHPFYTGKQKLVDSGGRVERFQRRYGRKTFTRDADKGDKAAKGEAKPAPKAAEAPEAEPPADEAAPSEPAAEVPEASEDAAAPAEA